MPAVRLFTVAVKMDFLVAELKTYYIYVTGIQETKWFNWV